jgi:hypothetical protein
MSTIDKLKRLTGETGAEKKAEPLAARSVPDEKQERLAALRLKIEAVTLKTKVKSSAALKEKLPVANRRLAELVDGVEVENEHGRFFLASRVLPGSSRHGHRNLFEALDFDMAAAGMLANEPAIGRHRPSDALFLDTETTGLTGGSGTMPFLVGLGWFENQAFHLHQLLARDFSEEKALLAHLKQIAARKKFLVTFNGKAFDVNLLATRFILNRLEGDLSWLPHLDLLHPSRRLLGHRLENCRLATLEEQILGVIRDDDVPGSEIPRRYFDWLRQRNPYLLPGIFEHNRLDVISMATLTAHLVEIVTAGTIERCAHTDDYLAAASLCLDRAQKDTAMKIVDALPDDLRAEVSPRSPGKLAELYKRTGNIDKAAQIWEKMCRQDPAGFYHVTELTKYLEHHRKDYNRAREIVEAALASGGVFSQKEEQSLAGRLKRLNKRINKRR